MIVGLQSNEKRHSDSFIMGMAECVSLDVSTHLESIHVAGMAKHGIGSDQVNPKMKLCRDPFPINMMEFGNKKILVRSHQADTTRRKNVVVSDDLKLKMTVPKSLEV